MTPPAPHPAAPASSLPTATEPAPGPVLADAPATGTSTAPAAPGSAPSSDAGAPRSLTRYVLLLGSMCALPAISTDIYLPSLPEVARDLGTSATAAQLTMTGMLIGAAVGQLVVGPVSDRFGRRRPVLVGVAAHVLTSLLCMVAPTIGAVR